jgi:hypothetical protein
MKRELRITISVEAETDCAPVGAGSEEHEMNYCDDAIRQLVEDQARFWQTDIKIIRVGMKSRWTNLEVAK